jgi:hypothetical protein
MRTSDVNLALNKADRRDGHERDAGWVVASAARFVDVFVDMDVTQ